MKDWPTERMSLSDLTPADYNPRIMSDKSKVGLTHSLDRFGLVQPIVWNKKTGNIVGGHQRYSILKEKGIEDTDVVVVDLPEEEEVALNIALNNPTIQGDWSDSLAEVLSQYTDDDLFAELGFDDLAERLNIVFNLDPGAFEPGSEDEQGKLDVLDPKIIKCPHCEEDFDCRGMID